MYVKSGLKISLDRNNKNRNSQNLYDECKRLMNYHVVFTMKDGRVFDGIIESVDPENVTILVGEDVMEQEGENQNNQQRQFNRPRRFRRFRRRVFPLAALIGLYLLPYPYYAPPYPFYPY